MRKSVGFFHVALLSVAIIRCTPDFEELTAGGGGHSGCSGSTCGGAGQGGGAGVGGGKSSSEGGTSSAGLGGGAPAGGMDAGGAAGSGGTVSPEGGMPGAGGTLGSGGVPEGGTTSSEGGSAGSGPQPCTTSWPLGTVLWSFDQGMIGETGLSGNWGTYVEEPSGESFLAQSAITWNTAEGKSCPGSLQLTVPFTKYGDPQKVMANVNFSDDWTDKKTLHGWAKILAPATGSVAYLNAIMLSVSSGASYEAFRGTFVNAPLFSDRNWHEITIPLNPVAPPPQSPAFIPAPVRQIGIQVSVVASAPAGGPAAPVETSILLDDLWLE